MKKNRFVTAFALCCATVSLTAVATWHTQGRSGNVRADVHTDANAQATEVRIDETTFPDKNFRDYVKNNFDIDQNGTLSEKEIEITVRIGAHSSLHYCHIESLKGIEYFTELKELDCMSNNIDSLDVSKNVKLEYLCCNYNKLTSLDVSKNVNLKFLYVGENQLASIDLSKNTNLEILNVGGNKLTTLDVSKNTKLTHLECSSNKLKSLDISKNTNIDSLRFWKNSITKIDLSKNTKLASLKCDGNGLTSLDLGTNLLITELVCGNNDLSTIDLSKHTNLTYLDCRYSPNLKVLDVSKNTKLKELYCQGSAISELKIGRNSELVTLDCYLTHLRKLDVSGCPNLACLDCGLVTTPGFVLDLRGCSKILQVIQDTTPKHTENYTYRRDNIECVFYDKTQLVLLSQAKNVKVSSFSDTSATLGWNQVLCATGYEVYMSTSADGQYTNIGYVDGTGGKKSGLTPGKKYYFKVRPFRTTESGREDGPLSSPVSVVLPLSAPNTPTAKELSSSKVKVSWKAVQGAAGYQVWRSTSLNGTYSCLGTVTGTSRECPGLTGGQKYYFKVRAYNVVDGKKSYGLFSTTVSIVPPLPAPGSLKVTAVSSSSANVSWKAVKGATGYKVYRAESEIGPFTLLETVTTTSRICKGLKSGQEYFFLVRACKRVDGKLILGEVTSLESVIIPLPAPANVKATVSSSTKVTVSWSAVKGATGYEVFRSESASGTYTKLGAVTTTSRACPGLTTGKTYYFKVRAYVEIDGVKHYGGYSTVVNAKPKA